jgi:hypothetical protein
VAAAIRDTSDIWISSFLPQDRARIIEVLGFYLKRVTDETARTDLVAFTSALEAAN